MPDDNPVLTCDLCGGTGEDVKVDVNPYAAELYQDYELVKICDRCYEESAAAV